MANPFFNDPAMGWNATPADPYTRAQLFAPNGPLSGQTGSTGPGGVGGPLSGTGGWQQRAMQWLDPQVALPIAAQLMSGSSFGEGLAGAFQAAGQAAPGMQQRAALNAYLKSKSGLSLTPEEQQMLQADPELGRAFLAQQLTPKLPTWGVIGKDSSGAEQYGWINASSQTVTPVAAPGGGASHMFPGTSVEATGLSWLVDNGKITQEQAAQLAASKQVTGVDGTIYLATPQGIFGKPPDGGPAKPVGQGGSAPKDAGGAPAGMIPIGKGKLPELVVKNRQLYSVVSKELPIAQANFDALTKLGNQAAAAGGTATQWMASPEYQQAISSINTIVSSYLYSVSGQTANPGEVKTLVASLQPFPGESEASIANKKARLETMVQGVQIAANGGEVPDDIKQKAEAKPGAAPARPASVPSGSAYSPSRKMWKSPDGAHLFDEQGALVQ